MVVLELCTTSFATYRHQAKIFRFWCIDSLDLEFALPLRGGADDDPHFTRPDLSRASLFS
jgi:hypothetical protein